MSPRPVVLQTASNERYARGGGQPISSTKTHLKTDVFQCFSGDPDLSHVGVTAAPQFAVFCNRLEARRSCKHVLFNITTESSVPIVNHSIAQKQTRCKGMPMPNAALTSTSASVEHTTCGLLVRLWFSPPAHPPARRQPSPIPRPPSPSAVHGLLRTFD